MTWAIAILLAGAAHAGPPAGAEPLPMEPVAGVERGAALEVREGPRIVVDSTGKGRRLAVDDGAGPAGVYTLWVRCTDWGDSSDGRSDRDACGAEGRLGWTRHGERFAMVLQEVTAEPDCPEAAELSGLRLTGRFDEQGFVGPLTSEGLPAEERALDLAAVVNDALQRHFVPWPDGPLRDGATWHYEGVRGASGMPGHVALRWTATRDGREVEVALTEEIVHPRHEIAPGRIQSASQQRRAWLQPGGGLLATGRWETELALRVEDGEGRWGEGGQRCTGEVRPARAPSRSSGDP